MRKNFGSVEFEGRDLWLQQEPYADGNHDEPYYSCHACDDAGDDYMIRWPVIDIDAADESDACDWDDYTVRKL